MQPEHIRELAQQFLSARDLNNLVSHVWKRVDWYVSGNKNKAIWVGARHTSDEVRDFFKLLWENTEPISASVDNLLVEDNYALIVGEFSIRMLQTNKIVEPFFCIQMTFENNKIVKYRLSEESYTVSEARTG